MEIVRSEGTTPSERRLAQLCEKTFLNLWSYPNLFRDQGARDGQEEGKELCDLLVVCGNDIIIFSDKSISFPDTGKKDTDWIRWCKRAIIKSSDQIRGAQRWIERFPDRIFLDKKCTQAFHLAFPPKNERKFHRVVVALNSSQACRKYIPGSNGSLLLIPTIKGSDHTNPTSQTYMPFAIGDIDPNGEYVHVFDDVTLEVIMSELDTITDFAGYLSKKENFIRSGGLAFASSELDLLAHYITHTDGQDRHGFIFSKKSKPAFLQQGLWSSAEKRPAYINKKRQDEPSYIFDKFVNIFTKVVMDGTAQTLEKELNIKNIEPALRIMAKEPRLIRRAIGTKFLQSMLKAPKDLRFTSAIIPYPDDTYNKTLYFLMQMPIPEGYTALPYQEYRQTRLAMLAAYCRVFKSRHQYLARAIGIGVETMRINPKNGVTYDLYMEEFGEWTSALQEEAEKLSREAGIYTNNTANKHHESLVEYPHTFEK